MARPAFLVEGDLEQKFVQKVCNNAPVQKINCNGDSVSLEAIAKRVGTQARLLQRKCSPLVVIFDREHRRETTAEIEGKFRELLIQEHIITEVIIGIPDRDIENWILADWQTFVESSGTATSRLPEGYEGKKGKSLIRKSLPKGRTYVETTDGVAWLKAARPSIIAQESPSFRRLLAALRTLPCWWLEQPDLPGLTADAGAGTNPLGEEAGLSS